MNPIHYDWTYGTNTTLTTYQPVGDIVSGRYYVDQPLPVKPVTAPAVKEEPVLDKGPSLVKRWREAIAKITGQPTKAQLEALPRLAGGSQESEIKVHSEHKKKITIERKVGVTRDKGNGDQEDLHRGKVELVRTMEGQPHLMDQIGIKVEASGGSYVEVPYEQFLAALEDLRLPIEQQPTVEHEIEENGHA
jgi:hypothetical protein